ncbi:MAG TPA: cysteine--1-D-myo-inosityl 2-amino-2-deoxy-alpha-D-glucopyranoside ligase [Dermatophilaceae bacterium]|nr:cysteine--1-D-myo-inosityl 2-amino-2-deoxy-alpha-D-glucopyranoside ligase [Dermatophilaceae bacterium]
MESWPSPLRPVIPGSPPALRLFDTAAGKVREVETGQVAGMYVCGITPYDATHLGHAATYVTFDLVNRVLRDSGREVVYVQNVTDVDEPLLERAARDGVDWQDLAAQETALFRQDMAALRVLPPEHYHGVVDSIPYIVDVVARLLEAGTAYRLGVAEGTGADVYLDVTSTAGFGQVSGWSRAEMLEVFAERGGDPERPGKRDALDPLLWRAAREGEPCWDGGRVLGRGRPGWHIECTTIALTHLGMGFAIQGGGSDLVFPHHEMSAAQGTALTGQSPFATHYVHQAMVGLDGEKMSKSKGNLVLVSRLLAYHVDPMAIRLALLRHHYRTDWEWTGADLTEAVRRLKRWRMAAAAPAGPPADSVIAAIRSALSNDLDAAAAVHAVDRWADDVLDGSSAARPGAGTEVARAVDALLGVSLAG